MGRGPGENTFVQFASCNRNRCFFFRPQISVELRGRLPSAGNYVLVVEYSSEEELPQTVTVTANAPGMRTHRHRVMLLRCNYRYREDPADPRTLEMTDDYKIKA